MATCRTCGYLSHHPMQEFLGGPMFEEVTQRVRDNVAEAVNLNRATADLSLRHMAAQLVCLQRSPAFPSESLSHAGLKDRPADAQRELVAERDCGAWIEWERGLSPRGHAEKQRVVDWHAMERRANWRAVWITIGVGVILTLAQIAAAFLVAALTATPGSTAYKWLHRPGLEKAAAPPSLDDRL